MLTGNVGEPARWEAGKLGAAADRALTQHAWLKSPLCSPAESCPGQGAGMESGQEYAWPFTHSFSTHLLNTYYVSETTQDMGMDPSIP